MTRIWEKNIEALQDRYSEIDELPEKCLLEVNNKNNTGILAAAVEEIAGRKILYAVKENIQYQLDSLYNSNYMIDTWFAGLQKLRFHSKVIMFGLGNGMYIEKLLKETDRDVVILIYEPSLTILCKAMEHFDLSGIIQNERIILYVKDCMPVTFGECLEEFIKYEDLSGLIQSKYLNYSELFIEESNYFDYEIKMESLYEGAAAELWEHHGKVYYSNTMSNIRHLYKSKNLADLWEKIPKDIPAVIVAAGPSLDNNIEVLKKAKGKCFLIAADSALKPLLKHDIIPDIFVSVDGGKMQAHFSDERVKKIPLLCNLQSQETLLQQHEAEEFFTRGVDVYVQKYMEEKGIVLPGLNTGGSVANDCFELARVLGLKTIVLVGQDLAYTDNKTHSADTVRGEWNTEVASLYTLTLEGVDGNPILSSYEFQIYLHWFEERIKKFPELKVIDATEGGAKIHGALMQTLEQAVDELCKEPVDMGQYIRETGTLMTEEEQIEFKQYMQQIPDEIQRSIYLMKQCIRDYDKILTLVYQDKYRTRETLNLFKKVNMATEQVEAIGAMEYVENHMQNEITKMLDQVYDTQKDEKKEMLEACNIGKQYLQKLLRTAEEVLPDIKQRIL